MKIVIAGGTGFLGRPLVNRLAGEGHDVTVLTRSVPDGERAAGEAPRIGRMGWKPDGGVGRWASSIDGTDVVINLAGESIAGKRWTSAQKARIRDSRLLATRSLVSAMRAANTRPSALLSGSAVGYYGDAGDRELTETSPPGTDFLSGVAVAWEREAQAAEAHNVRVVLIRTGIVLEADGGALEKMLPPFRMFVGGPVGSGRQYMSWIHRDDWVELVRWAAGEPRAKGAVNATAPSPVTNREFSKTLGRVLGRPSLLPAPGFALRLALGEMAGALLLSSQRVKPAAALGAGFRFAYTDLASALRAILRDT